MFRIGHYTGTVYDADKVSLRDIHECCSVVQAELVEIEGRLGEIAADLRSRCKNCRGCPEARKEKK